MAAGSETLPTPRLATVTVAGMLARAVVIAAVVAVVLGVPFGLGSKVLSDCSLAAIYAVIGISMNILVGYAGQISLGQQAFVGVGALVASNIVHTNTVTATDPFLFALSIAAAVGIGAATALVLGAVALRISGLYLALVTLVFGAVAADVVFTIESLNGHSAGVTAVRPAALAGDGAFYLFCLAAVAVVLYVDWSFTRTKAGRAVNALRESELVAQAFAVDVVRYKLLAFSLSGAIAGLAGGIFAFYTESFSDKTYTYPAGFTLALIFLVMVVIGGLGSRSGVVIASAFFGLLNPILDWFFNTIGRADWYVDHKNYVPGLIGATLLLQTIIMNPGGLGQVVRPIGRWLAGGRFTFHDESESADVGGRHVRA
ncbi:MAG: branched-chain amino acid transport system permease protein [Frankiales bacterium]|jgi:branched-chain amino acid transport system permease protein|nr:branched-chain amino acid transport system permease protein [Frankiales bacterium]